jgi:hypothetical protein
MKLPVSLILALMLTSCAQTNYKSHELDIHASDIARVELSLFDAMEFETQALETKAWKLVAQRLPDPPPSLWSGWVISNAIQPRLTTKFRIVSVTEEYIPLTGEIKKR